MFVIKEGEMVDETFQIFFQTPNLDQWTHPHLYLPHRSSLATHHLSMSPLPIMSKKQKNVKPSV